MALPKRRNPAENQRPRDGAPGSGPDWRALYEIENPAEVEAYVRRNPVLVSVLARASFEISARFGPDATVALEHVADPDDGPGGDYLSLDIRTDLGDDEAYTRRNQFDREWWLDAIRQVPGMLTIDLARR